MRRRLTGLKHATEAWEYTEYIGRGAMYAGRSYSGSGSGLHRRENAGMSSESGARNFESLRFPGEGSSAQGKSGPKPRPKGVGDGQRVEIPVLPNEIMTQ